MGNSGKHVADLKAEPTAWSRALRLTTIYLLLGCSWIIFSDEILPILLPDASTRLQISVIKGLGFIILTGTILQALLWRMLNVWQHEVQRHSATIETLQRTDRALRTLSECGQSMVRATSEQALLEDICRIITEKGGHRMAWVGFAENDAAHSVRIACFAGNEAGYLAKAQITWSDSEERGRGPTGISIRTGVTVVCNDFQQDHRTAAWSEEGLKRGFLSSITIPLRHGGVNFGVVMIYGGRKDAFNATEVELLTRLTDDLAFGIHSLRARAEREQIQLELASSEERLRRAVVNSPVPILLHAEDGCILQSSNVWHEITGYSREEMPTIQAWVALAYGDRQDEVLKEVKKTYEQIRRDGREDFRVRIRDGSYRTWAFSTAPLGRLPDGRRLAISMAKDITDRKRSEAELRASELRFRTLLEEAPLSVSISRDGIGMYANHRFRDLFGLKQEQDWLGRAIVDYYAPEARADCLERIRKRHAGLSVPTEFESIGLSADGRCFPMQLTVSSVELADGPAQLAFIADITERRRAEEKLRLAVAEAEQFRTALDGVPAFVFIKDQESRYFYANQATLNHFGCTASELVGCADDEFFPPAAAQQFRAADLRVLQGEQTNHEVEIVGHDGALHTYLEVKTPIYSDDAEHEIVGLLGISTDITQRKEMESFLRASENRFRSIIEASPIPFALHNQRAEITYLNAAFVKTFGYDLATFPPWPIGGPRLIPIRAIASR